MNAPRRLTVSLMALLLVTAMSGCEFNVSTAHLENARLAKGVDENQNAVDTTRTFSTSDKEFHCLADLANAPDGTRIKAVWRVIKAEGAAPDQVIVEKELQAGSEMNKLHFSMTTETGFPPGDYRCDLYLNAKRDGSSKPETSLPFVIR